MTAWHHPTEPVLADLSAGNLDEGSALVVATHVALCAACREKVRSFEDVGGVLLKDIQPTPLKSDARGTILEKLDLPAPPEDGAVRESNPEGLPAPLANYNLGPWRWIGRGVYWRTVETHDSDSRVFMLKAAPGTPLPHHRHQGREWTCVLQGAFRHDLGRYGAGDFDEADESVEHRPFIETGEPCICLVAMQGGIELQGWFGRLLQPLVRL